MALILSHFLNYQLSNPNLPKTKLSNRPNFNPNYVSLPSKPLLAPKTLISDFNPNLRSHTNIFSSFRFLQVDDEESSPWEGALVYKRNPSITHLEFCTTLERLGLGKLSSDTSRSRASDIGIRVTKAVKDYPFGTPVQISIDVTRKKKELKLDGILRTVISLGCNRCGEPATECIYTNFTLLLTEEPIEEPDHITLGTIYGDDKIKAFNSGGEGEDDDDAVDLDDQLYFPAEEKEIDFSKNIRDLIHIEITYNAICAPSCRGLCLKCGINLNKSSCNCSKEQESKKDMVASET